jgi:hypothetical protein
MLKFLSIKKYRFLKLLLFVIYNLFCFLLQAQSLFNKKFGSPYWEEGNAITISKDRGYIVAGVSMANGAGGDIFLMKINQYGLIQWQKNYFGVNIELLSGVFELSNGNLIIGGNTYSYGSGCYDAIQIMTDSIGNILWSKTYGDIDCNHINGFSTAHGNGFILAGHVNKGWLLKTDQNGNVEWSNLYNGTGSFSSVKPTYDGGYIAVGNQISVIKTDGNGNAEWFRQYLSFTGNTRCTDVIPLEDGSAVLTGQVYYNASGGVSDIFLLKIDTTGNLVWFKTYGSTFFDYGFSIKKTLDNGFIVAGYTNSFGHGEDDAVLLKTDADGNFTWAKTYGDVWKDRALQVLALNDSGFIFVGYSYNGSNNDSSYVYVVKTNSEGNSCNSIDWTPVVQTQFYQSDSALASPVNFGIESPCNVTAANFMFYQKEFCIANNIDEGKENIINVYPNPASNELYINDLIKNSVINLYDMNGILILSQHTDVSSIVDISHLPNGIYVLQMNSNYTKVLKINSF